MCRHVDNEMFDHMPEYLKTKLKLTKKIISVSTGELLRPEVGLKEITFIHLSKQPLVETLILFFSYCSNLLRGTKTSVRRILIKFHFSSHSR